MPLKEKALIARIRRQSQGGREVIRGIGDDCAVLRIPSGHEALITTDFSLEGMHFRRDWQSPQSIGHRCLTRGLSDIAAMGGQPIAAFLSLAVPRNLPQKWVDGFISGLLALARQFNVALAGGDTAESPQAILADIVALGSVPKGRAIGRSGAKPGDRIFVSGALGASAAAIQQMSAGQKISPTDFAGHFFPQPRVALGRQLNSRRIASSMIDLSDGLSSDLAHICEESGVGAEISDDKIPRAEIKKKKLDLELALHGGEDYELLFTARGPVPRKLAGVPLTEIGCITNNPGIFVLTNRGKKPLPAKGWQHFTG